MLRFATSYGCSGLLVESNPTYLDEIAQLELGKHLPVSAVHISLDLVVLKGTILHKAAGIPQQWIDLS